MAKTMLSMKLPKVGDVLSRIVSACALPPIISYNTNPCVVTYVNEAHHWYQVEFVDTGIKECYSLPDFDHGIFDGILINHDFIPVVCLETGNVFPSISECAKEMKLHASGINRQISGEQDHCGGYHFETIL